MKILDEVIAGIKNVFESIARLFGYDVTLGHAESPRAKADSGEVIEPKAVRIGEREVSSREPRSLEDGAFLVELDKQEAGKAQAFQGSAEYQEYLKDTNPFASIDKFYQKYNAKDFVNNLNENKDDFIQSPEYNNYLMSNPRQVFPFEVKEAYTQYLEGIPGRLEARMEEFEVKLHELFYDYEMKEEGLIKDSFIKSPEYTEMLNKMRTDINYKLTIEDVRNAYDEFKKRIPEENENFLNSLQDKDEFMNSFEYKNLNKEMLIVDTIKSAYDKFTGRIEEEKAKDEFIDKLKVNSDKFGRLSDYKPYRELMFNPFYKLSELKNVVNEFERKEFIDELPEVNREAFKESQNYRDVSNNPFSNKSELEAVYGIWREQKEEGLRSDGDQYLKELKEQLKNETGSDDYYNKFEEYRNLGENAYRYGVSRNDLKAAFDDYKKENPRTWGEYLWGS